MNVFRTNSHIMMAAIAAFIGSISLAEIPKEEVARLKATLQYVAPMVTKKVLKHQNPYLSDVGQGLTATLAHKLDTPQKGEEMDLTPKKEDLAFFAVNSGARAIKTVIENNTSLNEKKLEKMVDDNLPECVAKIIKYVAPFGLEFVYNSLAASAAGYVKKNL